MLTGGSGARIQIFQQQADAALSQASPGSGTQYEILAETKNVRLLSVSAKCTWTVQPDPIQIFITIDGNAFSGFFNNPVSNTWYDWVQTSWEQSANSALVASSTTSQYRAFLLEGRTIKVEAEITGGTVSNLTGKVKYAKIP